MTDQQWLHITGRLTLVGTGLLALGRFLSHLNREDA